jgi:raffinose/stachyose/melibiose transport system substrate-binding protein
MRLIRPLAVVTSITLLVAGMAACSSSSGSGSSVSPEESKSIKVLGYQPIPQKILDDFKTQTGITVSADIHNGGDITQVLQSRVAAKSDVDVLNLAGGAQFNKYATAGTFADLTGNPLLGNVKDIGVQPGVVKGKNYGFSMTSYVTGVFYNKDLFKKLGISIPTNWDELMADAAKIKASGTSPFVFTAADAWTNQYFYHNAIAIWAKDNPNFIRDVSTGSATWKDNTLFVNQVKRFETIVKDGYLIPGAQSMKGEDGQAQFAAGKAAMYLMGTWTLSSLKPNGFDVGMFPLPINDPGQPPAVASSLSDNMYAVASWSKNKAAAEKFLAFLATKDVATAYSQANNVASTIKGVTATFSPYQPDADKMTENAAPYPTRLGPSVDGSGPNVLGDIVAGVSNADKAIASFQALQEQDNKTNYYASN